MRMRGQIAAIIWQHRFALSVRALMRHKVLTQDDLAETAQVSRSALNHILTGRQNASVTLMLSIAISLDAVELIPSPSSIAELLSP